MTLSYPKGTGNTYRPCGRDWIECCRETFNIFGCVWNNCNISWYNSPNWTYYIRPIRDIIGITMRTLISNQSMTHQSPMTHWRWMNLTVNIFWIQFLISPSIKWHWNQVCRNSQFVDSKHFWIIRFIIWPQMTPDELLPNRIHLWTFYNLT